MDNNMPAFTPRLTAISKARYNIAFLHDGYPGKNMGDTIACHPIYGVYVIRDYLFQYKKKKDSKYKKAAIRVADAAINRMEEYKSSLVFWYKEGSAFNSLGKDYYSALTQAYYLEVFAEMSQLTNNNKYKEAAEGVYESLKIPVYEGGVFHHCSMGPSIQEYPSNPNGYVLNGWLSALSSIKKYSQLTNNNDADQFWRANLKTITRLLPLYDAPHVANSRYTLNGIATIKIHSPSFNIELKSIRLGVPKENEYALTLDSNRNYLSFIERSTIEEKGNKIYTKNHSAKIKVLFSRFSYPLENEIIMEIDSPRKGNMNLFISSPKFTPQKMISNPYKHFTTIALEKGVNKIKVKAPWNSLEDIGTPIRFKQFNDKWHNVYHFIHINRLEEFYKETKDPILLFYMNRWKGYVNKWPEMKLYRGLEHVPYKKS